MHPLEWDRRATIGDVAELQLAHAFIDQHLTEHPRMLTYGRALLVRACDHLDQRTDRELRGHTHITDQQMALAILKDTAHELRAAAAALEQSAEQLRAAGATYPASQAHQAMQRARQAATDLMGE